MDMLTNTPMILKNRTGLSLMKRLSCLLLLMVSMNSWSDTKKILSEQEAIKDYVERKNSAPHTMFPVKAERVGVDKFDLDKNGSLDLCLSSLKFCSSKGCEIDVYLCSNSNQNCEGGHYCYAGTVSEGELKKKVYKCVDGEK
ncbi:MAG TPA: hypothetical protein VFM18_02090 [Methanosarcina sp.]|nr:hypothetical protein [Methanosarcina sp.]